MNKDILKKAAPYFAAIIIFLVITFSYFSPLLEGKKLQQHDIAMYKGMSKEIVDFREATGEEPLWTNSMFGGMPAWQISVIYSGNLMRYVDDLFTLWLPRPADYVFLYFLGFFILMLVLRINPWVSIIGAIAFALSSYFFIILGAGHTSKAHAIGYMAPVLAGIILTYRGKYITGALMTALFLALEVRAGHPQITYYLLLVVLFYGIYQLIKMIQDKRYNHFFKATGLLVAAALMAVLTHATNLWATYDYGKDTMRGKPELTKNMENKSGGLDRDYITHWSYGIGETWSLLIPNVKGGASGVIGQQKEMKDIHERALKKADPRYRKVISQQVSAYWGDQPGTSGPVYVGVIVVFLFVLGMFLVKDRLKWVLFAATLLSIFLSWGHHMMWFTDLFIDYVPGYNKFRAVSMTLVIAELTIPILAFMMLHKIVTEPDIIRANMRPFLISLGLTGGIILLFALFPAWFFSFTSEMEQNYLRTLPNNADSSQIIEAFENIEQVRIAIFRADAWRSLLFVAAAAGLLFVFVYLKISKVWFILGIAILILVDMVLIDRRYLNNDDFIRARQADMPFTEGRADQVILSDPDPDFRVLDLTVSTFNDASCSYFHKSIGGYHGAKLQRYQDLIDEYLNAEIQDLRTSLPGQNPETVIQQILKRQKILNMLNMRYIIVMKEMSAVPNRNNFGHAWFVKEIDRVKSADEEIEQIGEVDLKEVAVVDEKFSDNLPQQPIGGDTAATISLRSYAPNKLVYDYRSATNQLAVFSEIYYDKGWNAYLDGELVPHFRADYVLRAMSLPAGEHTIEFHFEPRVWKIGEKISLASSLLLILMVLGSLAAWFVRKRKEEPSQPKA
ncbi:MAG: YfhO family protein [bacterium]